jgi:hypothetical protein
LNLSSVSGDIKSLLSWFVIVTIKLSLISSSVKGMLLGTSYVWTVDVSFVDVPITAVPWRKFILFLEAFALGTSNTVGDEVSLLVDMFNDSWLFDFSSLFVVVLVSSVISTTFDSFSFLVVVWDLSLGKQHVYIELHVILINIL